MSAKSNSTNPKILLINWQAAGWDVITPLLERGELPNLARLVAAGVMGPMTSIRPLMEPMVHTSLATGKYPNKHGIFGTHEVCDHGRRTRAITSQSRRAKAFWEILSQNDIRCNVVHFPGPEPAEEINGAFVSCGFFGVTRQSSWSPAHVPEDSVFPPDLAPTLQEFIVSLEDLDPPTVGLFVPRMRELPSRDKRLAGIAMGVAHTLSVHAVMTWLMENTDWRVMSVAYPAIEVFSRDFLRYHPPRLDWVDPDEFDLFKDVINSAARLCDLLLGRLLQLGGEDATVVVYSPRAYLEHHDVPRGPVPSGPRTEASQHRPQGIFVMRGEGTRRDELMHGVRTVDICPTVLRLCDVPVPEDMDGRILSDAFARPLPQAETIETWETHPPVRPELPADMRPVPWWNMMSFAAAHAHRTAMWVQMQNDWNQAEADFNLSHLGLAVPLLTRLYYVTPFWTDMAPLVAEAFSRAGLSEDALTVARNFAAVYGQTPAGKFMAGILAQSEGQEYEAQDLFEAAAKDKLPIPQLYFHLGEIHRRAGRLVPALECFERATEIDPNFIPAYLGRVWVHRKLGEPETGLDEALEALAIDFSCAPAHYLLGLCLEDLDEPEQAKAAYTNALRFNSNHERAKARSEALQAGDQHKAIDEDEELAASPLSPGDVDQLRLAVAGVRREIMAWGNRYIQSFHEADQQLDAYLAENARQRADQDEQAPPAKPSTVQVPSLKAKDLVVRPIMPADLAQLGAMVAPVLSEHHRHDVFVLHKTGQERLLGAVSLRTGGSAGKGVTLLPHVAPADADADLDEETIWMLLIRLAVARAAAAGATNIMYAFSPENREHLGDRLEGLGFIVKKHETVLRTDMAATRDRCLRLVERYRQRQAIPDDVRVATLEEVPIHVVDRFFLRFFDDGIGPRRLELDQRLSQLVMRGDEIIAAYTGYVQDKTWVSPRLAVLEEYRNGWATPMLIGYGSKSGAESGLESILMYTDETAFPEMIRIGRRTGGEEVTRTWVMGLDLVAPWPQAGAASDHR